LASFRLSQFPGKVGISQNALLFISKPNQAGGRVWFSTSIVNTIDYAMLVGGQPRGSVLVLSGAHGTMDGTLEAYPGIIAAERDFFGKFNIDVEIIDIMRISGSRLRDALNRDGRIICSWCVSAYTKKTMKALWGRL